MAAALPVPDDTPASRLESYMLGQVADERRHRRIVISLPVRFMAADESEHKGLLFDMSPGGLSVTSDTILPLNSRTVLYVDEIGRVEGFVARHHKYGFAVKLSTTQNRRDKIAEHLTLHANKHRLREEDFRRHERSETDQEARCFLPDGAEIPCRVVDLSLSGAAIAVSPKPAMGAEIVIGRMRGKVVRVFESGVAIRFIDPAISQAMLKDRLTRRPG